MQAEQKCPGARDAFPQLVGAGRDSFYTPYGTPTNGTAKLREDAAITRLNDFS